MAVLVREVLLPPSPAKEAVIFRDTAEALMLLSTMSGIIFLLSFTVFPCKINLPQVKRNLKSFIRACELVYELPHELPNDLKLMNDYISKVG